MNEKDATIQKVLAELGLKEEPELSPEQEELLKTALDPELQRLASIEKLFKQNP